MMINGILCFVYGILATIVFQLVRNSMRRAHDEKLRQVIREERTKLHEQIEQDRNIRKAGTN
jgi:sensor domain CHASE-containing protein